MPKISVIVPIYKVEQYLKKCVDSILKQTFKDIEVILVDDGSPDNCPRLCDEFAEQDNRIKVIHKQNGGVSAARNSGLDIATGEYIAFVDSDDYIESNMYSSMINIAEKYNSDIVMCDCIKDFSDHSEIYSHDIREGFYNFNQLKEEYYPHLLIMENVEYPATISNCLLLFKRELLNNDSYKIRYLDGVRFSEDLLFGAQIMLNAKSFFYMKGECFYHYVMNLTSATHVYQKDKWNDYIKLYENAERYFLKSGIANIRLQLDKMLLFFLYNAVGEAKCAGLQKEEKKMLIKSILNDSHTLEMFKRIRISKLPISWKLKIITYQYKLGLSFIEGLKWSRFR
ncbi:MAG: glycosyltransferase [Clostridia bacterium]|nr:glycosyltransferase [Clostridia bacterium]